MGQAAKIFDEGVYDIAEADKGRGIFAPRESFV
jgi:hypothetical protein